MVEEKQECCEELGERKEKIEYGCEEPSDAVVNPDEPDKPRVTHMSGIKPERKKMSVWMKFTIIAVMVAILLSVSAYVMISVS